MLTDIITFKFEGERGKPFIYIKRQIDSMETQELRITLSDNPFLSTESGNWISLSGRDEESNYVEIQMPVSIEELKKALTELK